MTEEILRVKMRNNRLEVIVWEYADYENVKEQLFKRLDKMSQFLTKGQPKVLIAGKEFSEGQKRELVGIIKTDYNVGDVDFCTLEHLEKIHQTQQMLDLQPGVSEAAKRSVFKMEDIPTGTVVESSGDLTIVGDVAGGAELIAGGSICVLGALRGTAYAGADGDDEAVIVANVLEATKLRISGCIGIAPKDNKSIGVPEYAHVSEGGIVIEPVKADENAFEDEDRQRGIIGSIKRFFTYDH